MDSELHSKTFVFDKVMNSVPFVEALNEIHVAKAWADNKIRVTVEKWQIEDVNKLAEEHNAMSEEGDKGEWKAAWK